MARVEDYVKPSQPLLAEALDDRPIWEIIVESGPEIPPEERAAAPHDGGRHYQLEAEM